MNRIPYLSFTLASRETVHTVSKNDKNGMTHLFVSYRFVMKTSLSGVG